MGNEARRSGVPARRIHLVVAIDRLLARLLVSAPKGSWVVKGGYANQLRRPDAARFTEDLDLKIEAGIDEAPILLAGGFATDLGDGFAYEASTAARVLDGPPGGGLRFAVAARLMGDEFVHFKVDLSISDVVVGRLEQHLSDPVLQRLGFERSRFPVYPIAQHFAEKFHAFTLPRDQENSRARDLVDLVWFVEHFTFRSDALIEACEATFRARADQLWPPPLPIPPASWERPFGRWRAELGLQPTTTRAARDAVRAFLEPVFRGHRGMTWDPEGAAWS
ncbi:MAG TPA: nucleotidyl transferase AbiEii/AbiGii toxin family protein [Candidatus Limnocylindrales bacterium]